MEKRNDLLRTLNRFYGQEDEPFHNCVFLFGHKSLTKTVVNEFLTASKKNIISTTVHANECYSNNIMFELIINALQDFKLTKETNYSSFSTKLDLITDFIRELKDLRDGNYVIVIENAEKLRDMDKNILPLLTKLQDLTGLNISCIIISSIVIEKYGLTDVIKIHVPEYSKQDITDILMSQFDEVHRNIQNSITNSPTLSEQSKQERMVIANTMDQTFYGRFVDIFLNVFYKACRDITELTFLSNKSFAIYYMPVLNGEIDCNDITNLWRNISKNLKKSLNTIYMRIDNISSLELKTSFEESDVDSMFMEQNSTKQFAQNLELPFYGKYLLIASFLASHNDPLSDKRLFMKHHGKERKRMRKVKAQAKVLEKMGINMGPKSFKIDRLLAIFYAILDEKVGLSCNLLAQISTLVDLNFLTFTNDENNIMDGTARLHCTVGIDFVTNIGKVVGFNVKQYLTDLF
ncbi:unnamed protein product [Diamesa serratosioi]